MHRRHDQFRRRNELQKRRQELASDGAFHVAPDTVLYEFTVADPMTFAKPWTAAIPMTKTDGPIFEYACNEGNYGMTGILSGDSSRRGEGGRNPEGFVRKSG